MTNSNITTQQLDQICGFMYDNNFSLEVSKGDHITNVFPKVGKANVRKDFFAGMEMIIENGTFYVCELTEKGATKEYLKTKSLKVALKNLIKGNNRKA